MIVELALVEEPGMDRQSRIRSVQDALLVRLAGHHVAVLRRYATVPLLALEVDAPALRALAAMPDLVLSVKPDAISKPQ